MTNRPRLTIALGAALAVAAVVAGVRHREPESTTLFVGEDGMWAVPPTDNQVLARKGSMVGFADDATVLGARTLDYAHEALPAYAQTPRWYDVKPGALPQLTGDVTALSASTVVITCECPPCPKHRRHCPETTDAISEHTREPTGLLVRVHRKGQPPLPVNPNPYVPTAACECPRCP